MASQKQVSFIVDQHIIGSATELISDLRKFKDETNYAEEIEDLLFCEDYLSPLKSFGYSIKEEDDDFFWASDEGEESELFGSEDEAARNCCEANSIAPYCIPVHEWWMITSWLAVKLIDKGESVQEIYGFHIWGRTGTGQSVYMDTVMKKIAEEILMEDCNANP